MRSFLFAGVLAGLFCSSEQALIAESAPFNWASLVKNPASFSTLITKSSNDLVKNILAESNDNVLAQQNNGISYQNDNALNGNTLVLNNNLGGSKTVLENSNGLVGEPKTLFAHVNTL